jgi:hypothetical protein
VRLELTTSASERFREALSLYSGYMTEREVEQIARNVKLALEFLALHPRAGAFEELIQPIKARYRRWVVGNLKTRLLHR